MQAKNRTVLHLVLIALPLLLMAGWELPPQTNRMKPGFAPTPFSAEEIRRACDTGRWIETRISDHGKPPLRQLTVFIAANDQDASLTVQEIDDGGRLVGEKMTARVSWKTLQGHASFAEEACRIESTLLKSPLGNLPCWLYTVRGRENGRERVDRYWFAREMPGPPVRFSRSLDGQTLFVQEIVARGMHLEAQE